jgi:hypothetical protein
MRADMLEIKSGTTEITMNNPQIKVQEFIARQLGTRWNIITEKDTPVSEEVVNAVQATGGSIYSRVPGEDSVFYDQIHNEYVRLTGGSGSSGQELSAEPLTPQETAQIEAQVREELRLKFELQGSGGDSDQPTVEGPSQPYVTQQQYDQAWSKADISPSGDTPLPGEPAENVPGEPLEPTGPIEPVEPEPVIPIGPEDLPIP